MWTSVTILKWEFKKQCPLWITLSLHVVVLQWTVRKCTKNQKARVQPFFLVIKRFV